MKRSTDRILTTHVGSLVRTPKIIADMLASESGEGVSEPEFEEHLRAGVGQVVQEQVQAGVDVVSDGEYGKRGWTQYVADRLEGLEFQEIASREGPQAQGRDRERFAEFYATYNRIEQTMWMPGEAQRPSRPGRFGWACTGPIRYKGHDALSRDIANFKAALRDADAEEAFMPVVAPCSVETSRPNRHYETSEAFLFAVADALREEYRAIVDAGFILQVDDAWLPMKYSMMVPDGTLEDYQRWARVRVDALNAALAGIPEDRVRYHICWGSQNVPHMQDVPLEDVAELVLSVRAGAYAVEAANLRHQHEWKVWEDVKLPAGEGPDPGRGHPFDQHRRASRTDSLADREFRATPGPGECHRGHRLRVLPELGPDPGASIGAMGEVGGAGRRCEARERTAVGIAKGEYRLAHAIEFGPDCG